MAFPVPVATVEGMSEFKIGNVVKLKSGGPEMMVAKVITADDQTIDGLAAQLAGDGPRVECEWFAKDKLCKGNFSPEMLALSGADRKEVTVEEVTAAWESLKQGASAPPSN